MKRNFQPKVKPDKAFPQPSTAYSVFFREQIQVLKLEDVRGPHAVVSIADLWAKLGPAERTPYSLVAQSIKKLKEAVAEECVAGWELQEAMKVVSAAKERSDKTEATTATAREEFKEVLAKLVTKAEP